MFIVSDNIGSKLMKNSCFFLSLYFSVKTRNSLEGTLRETLINNVVDKIIIRNPCKHGKQVNLVMDYQICKN